MLEHCGFSYAVVGFAVGGAAWYLGRLATRPDGTPCSITFCLLHSHALPSYLVEEQPRAMELGQAQRKHQDAVCEPEV